MVLTGGLLATGLMLDAAFGEPKTIWDRVPHPAVLMGRAVDALETRLNHGDEATRLRNGRRAVAILAAGSVGIGLVLALLPGGILWQALGAAVLLAHRSLIEHVRAVANAFAVGLPAAREAVAHIVGRDVSVLDDSGVAAAAIESGAENFSDGVVAPAFWFLIGGLPGMLLYKTINTADSMIGHRSERFRAFGRAAARLDDLLNLVPARLTALLIALAAMRPAAMLTALRQARRHLSPNAGWPEAAMAAALGVELGGPRRYSELIVDGARFNDGARRPVPADIAPCVGLLWRAWAMVVALALIVWVAI
jgi:adenosylcobinamide-phosphate synthase